MIFTRKWSMPNKCTFSVPPIGEFVKAHLVGCGVIVDPFARDSKFGTLTNDLNPETSAMHHMDALEFLDMLISKKMVADAVIFDPPYSPRQITEAYASIGKKCGSSDTQNARLYKEVKTRLKKILRCGGKALSFGWNSSGFGAGFTNDEILLVSHGGAHNDTICMSQTRSVLESNDGFEIEFIEK